MGQDIEAVLGILMVKKGRYILLASPFLNVEMLDIALKRHRVIY